MKERKKRNSSFVFGRRRSRSLVGSITNEICSVIDKSLPQHERLKLLTRHSLDYALTIAERECQDETDLKSFKILCSEQVEKIDSALESLNIYKLSTSDEELTRTRILLNETCSHFSAAVAKLEEENLQWDSLTDEYRKELDRERDLSVMRYNGSFDNEEFEKLNYSQLFKDVSAIRDQQKFQIEKLKKTSVNFKSCLKSANKYISSVNADIECKFLHSVQEAPKTLIKQCIAEVS